MSGWLLIASLTFWSEAPKIFSPKAADSTQRLTHTSKESTPGNPSSTMAPTFERASCKVERQILNCKMLASASRAWMASAHTAPVLGHVFPALEHCLLFGLVDIFIFLQIQGLGHCDEAIFAKGCAAAADTPGATRCPKVGSDIVHPWEESRTACLLLVKVLGLQDLAVHGLAHFPQQPRDASLHHVTCLLEEQFEIAATSCCCISSSSKTLPGSAELLEPCTFHLHST